MQYGKSIVTPSHLWQEIEIQCPIWHMHFPRVAGYSFKKRSLVGRLVEKCVLRMSGSPAWRFHYCNRHPAGSEFRL